MHIIRKEKEFKGNGMDERIISFFFFFGNVNWERFSIFASIFASFRFEKLRNIYYKYIYIHMYLSLSVIFRNFIIFFLSFSLDKVATIRKLK